MTEKTGSESIRKPYIKPQLEKVRLLPEEATLGNCKTSFFTAGPGGQGVWKDQCTNPGGEQSCQTVGS